MLIVGTPSMTCPASMLAIALGWKGASASQPLANCLPGGLLTTVVPPSAPVAVAVAVSCVPGKVAVQPVAVAGGGTGGWPATATVRPSRLAAVPVTTVLSPEPSG